LRVDGDFNMVPAGVVLMYGVATAPTGWLLCDGSAVSRTTYATLFAAISTTYGIGNGTTTFNVPDFRSRIPVGAGTAGTKTSSGGDSDVDTGGDTLTVASNVDKWITGMAVAFTLSSGTITGLSSGNTYYVIRDSATTVQLASSLANAQNGTAVNMTAKSSPEWTITHTFTARTLAEDGGQESHAESSTESLAHTHSLTVYHNAGATNDAQAGAGPGSGTDTTTSSGGNAAMNIMNPWLAISFIIKT
jgi:microcystin-dependent protein